MLLYLFRRIEESSDGRPTLILDEAWLMLGHPEFRGKIRDWLKSMAKKTALFLWQLNSLVMRPTLAFSMSLLSQSSLPNLPAKQQRPAGRSFHALYINMGLNRRQMGNHRVCRTKTRLIIRIRRRTCRLYQPALAALRWHLLELPILI
ncbi:hypothetical protein [Klebsiella quasipneumoniae]|uniref:hypothetical protein n=1 Tax=Klebsiella quasipneumoniae TaxID=1463165 RepID=UPI00388E6DEA